MVNQVVDRELRAQLERLSPNQQREVVEFALSLPTAQPHRDTTGVVLRKLAGSLNKAEADEMMRVIDEEFGRVNPDNW